MEDAAAALVHAVMFPMPGPSHVNPMLHLAKILVGEGFHVTFVNTEHIQRKMFGWAEAEGKGGGMLRFVEIEDGLPEGHGRFEEDPIEMMAAVLNMEPKLVRILESIIIDDETMFGRPRPTCIIADAFCSWVQNVADRFSIPRVALWTTPIHANLAYHQRKLEHIQKTMFGSAKGGAVKEGESDVEGWDAGGRLRLRFVQISDGLPEGHGRFEEDSVVMGSVEINMAPQLARLLEGEMLRTRNSGSTERCQAIWPRPTCIIADAFSSWVQDVADRFVIPRVALWTTPIHANLAYLAHTPGRPSLSPLSSIILGPISS